jgi:hypothetical protein
MLPVWTQTVKHQIPNTPIKYIPNRKKKLATCRQVTKPFTQRIQSVIYETNMHQVKCLDCPLKDNFFFFFFFAFLNGHILYGYSMGNILEKIKKNFFFTICMDIFYKAIVWITFWRKLKKNFLLRFCMDIFYKAIVWVIFWRKFRFFFYVSVWTYSIRL